MQRGKFLKEFIKISFIYSAVQNGYQVRRLTERQIKRIYNKIETPETQDSPRTQFETVPELYEFKKLGKEENLVRFLRKNFTLNV